MAKKATLLTMNKQLEETKSKPENTMKKGEENPSKKKEHEKKTPIKDDVSNKEIIVNQAITPTATECHVPRGERADFLKITLTIPADLLTGLRALGMKRKANKMKDTDTSALIREAVIDFLNKNKCD